MARPTLEKKEKMVKLRISEELYDDLARRGKNMSETIRGMLKTCLEGSVPQKNPEKTENRVPQNPKEGYSIPISDETYLSLMGMIGFYGGSLENLVIMLDKAMNDGSVMYEDGRIVGVPQIDLERFYDACHEANIDPQNAIDKLVKEMEK